MLNIRRNTFETNSSSVHSITMCSKETFKKFAMGELFLKKYSENTWYTFEQMISEISDEDDRNSIIAAHENDSTDFEELISEYDFYTDSTFSGEYEEFYKEYTTASGETVVAFGYYGESY